MRNPDDPAAPSGKSVPDPDDDDSIDDTQLQEYKEELNSLQGFPVRFDRCNVNVTISSSHKVVIFIVPG